jgi:hypothetical protein
MSIIRIDRNPSRRTLSHFGIAWLVFVAAFGAVVWWREGWLAAAVALWSTAVVVPVIGWIDPRFMRIVYLGMSYAAWPVGFVVSHVILAAVYYLVLTPVGLAMRLLGHDPMSRRFDAGAATYWIERPRGPVDPRRYFRQF